MRVPFCIDWGAHPPIQRSWSSRSADTNYGIHIHAAIDDIFAGLGGGRSTETVAAAAKLPMHELDVECPDIEAFWRRQGLSEPGDPIDALELPAVRAWLRRPGLSNPISVIEGHVIHQRWLPYRVLFSRFSLFFFQLQIRRTSAAKKPKCSSLSRSSRWAPPGCPLLATVLPLDLTPRAASISTGTPPPTPPHHLPKELNQGVSDYPRVLTSRLNESHAHWRSLVGGS